MSYSMLVAKCERQDCVKTAIENDDEIALFRYADLYAKEGEDEMAHYLLDKARQAQKNNWAYDEAKDNHYA